jgi:hypothetical protein
MVTTIAYLLIACAWLFIAAVILFVFCFHSIEDMLERESIEKKHDKARMQQDSCFQESPLSEMAKALDAYKEMYQHSQDAPSQTLKSSR